MTRLRDGAFADFEAGGIVFPVHQVDRDAKVFQVGPWTYDQWGTALCTGARKIHIVCDFRATTKYGNKAVMRDFEYRIANQVTKLKAARVAASGDHRRIDSLDRRAFLRITCKACGRTRLEQVGFIVSMGRLGGRTIAEYERAANCGRPDCGGQQGISTE
jgi:hypothetical protein